MDTGIFGGKHKNMSVQSAVHETLEVINTCKKYGGKAIILIHPAYMSNIEMEYYKRIADNI